MLANVVEYVHSPHATAGALGPAAAARAPLTATLNEQVQAGERLLEMMAEQGGSSRPSGGSSRALPPTGWPIWPMRKTRS